jgi:hypothetical protein
LLLGAQLDKLFWCCFRDMTSFSEKDEEETDSTDEEENIEI